MSFRLKTVLGIAFIELILLSLLIVSSHYYLRSSNELQARARGETTVHLLSTMATDSVVAMDLATLDVMVEEVLQNKDIAYLRIAGRDGTVLAEGGKHEIIDKHGTHNRTAEIFGNIVIASYPIEVAGEDFGHVDLGLYSADIEKTLLESAGWMLGVAGVEIVLVAVFGVILGSILMGQLKQLQSGARRVASGELGYQIPVRGSDELADTVRSFNAMSRSLARTTESLKQARASADRRRAIAESTLNDAIANLPDGVIIADPASKDVQINRAFRDLHADYLEEHDQYSFRQLDSALSANAAAAARGAASLETLNGATPTTTGYTVGMAFETSSDGGRWTVRYKNGKTILYSASGMTNGGMVIVASDMTAVYDAEEKAHTLQREALQGQKLEAIGTLAGGIAHELNTPIQFIGDNLRFIGEACAGLIEIAERHDTVLRELEVKGAEGLDLAARRKDFDGKDFDFTREELPQAIEQSADGIRAMANIVLAMKEFAHPASKEKASIDVNRVLERAALVSRNEWKYVAELAREYADPAPMALANEGELNQVLLNVIVNAAHAIKEAGREKGTITLRTLSAAKTVRIEIADNGTGIPEAIQHRVFEQFFTTKEVGKGTGQGLALCNEFITKRNGGVFRFVTTPGEGTTFIIELPAAGAHA